MLHHLEATDPDYIDMIKEGPYVPTKIVPQSMKDGEVIEEHIEDKTKAEWTKEDKENVLKDAKAKNILFNSLDSVLTNSVISC